MPDPYVWRVYSIKPTRGGYGDETDITRYVDLGQSSFEPSAQFQPTVSNMRITFKADTPNLDFREGYRYAAGYRNPATGLWDASRQVYGGWVGINRGTAMGNRHIISQQLTEYDILFGRTNIIVWPDAANPGAAMPAGYSPKAWLVGLQGNGAPYDGIIPQRLGGAGGIDLNGVDDVFDSFTFDADAMPGTGMSEVPAPGHWGYCKLTKAIDDIVEVIRFKYPLMRPVAYFEAVVDSRDATHIVPRFRLKDKAALFGGVSAAFSVNPGPGEWRIEQPFSHERDFHEAAGRVDVKGAGTDLLTGVLVAATAYNPDHAAAYQTTWQTDDGWAAMYTDDKIGSLATAQTIASALEAEAWGGIGRLVFRTTRYTKPGEIVSLYIPQEGQYYANYLVVASKAVSSPGRPLWEITVGAEPFDFSHFFTTTVRKAAALAELVELGLSPGGSVVAGAPRNRVTYANPVHSGQNVLQAASDTVTALSTKPGYLPPGAVRTLTPPKRLQHQDTLGAVRDWVNDADGTGHPHHYIIPVTSTGDVSFPLPDPASLIRVKGFDATGALAGSATFSYKLYRLGALILSQAAIDALHPLSALREDVLVITVGGTLPAGGMRLLVSES